jgi:hypothetical protein
MLLGLEFACPMNEASHKHFNYLKKHKLGC